MSKRMTLCVPLGCLALLAGCGTTTTPSERPIPVARRPAAAGEEQVILYVPGMTRRLDLV
jgi:hypothetical protein